MLGSPCLGDESSWRVQLLWNLGIGYTAPGSPADLLHTHAECLQVLRKSQKGKVSYEITHITAGWMCVSFFVGWGFFF